MSKEPCVEAGHDASWRTMYIVGGVAAVLAAVVFRRNLGAEFFLLRSLGVFTFGPVSLPISAQDWFSLLQGNPLLGLTLLNLFDLVNFALLGIAYTALFGALFRQNKGISVLALVTGLLGVAVYFASNISFSMLNLSSQYALAGSAQQQALYLSAGEALLSINNPGTVYQGTGVYLSLFLLLSGGLLFSILMYRSPIFSTWTAIAGILANTFGLGYFVALVLAPGLNYVPPSISAIFLLVWNILMARRLFQLGTQPAPS